MDLNIFGKSPQIHVNANKGNVRKVQRLLDEDEKNLNLTDIVLDTPLHFAASGLTANHVELVNLLLSRGAKLDARNIHGKTALHKASRSNCCITVDILLNHGSDINNQSTTGMTPLHDASIVNAAEAVERLLERGAGINTPDFTGDTPLHNASMYGHTTALKVLLKYGAKINLQNSDGLTPLHVACFAGDRNLQVIDILLDNGADVNVKSIYGDTVLHKAVLRSYIHQPSRIYERLLEKGACIDVRNDKGETPYDFCLIGENDEKEIVIKTALERHIVKLKTAGFAVDISLNTDSNELKDMQTECVKELDKIKVTKIDDFFNLNAVFLNVKNPWYLRNCDTLQKLEEKLNCGSFLKDFPLYGKILRNIVKNAKHELDLLQTAFTSFNSKKRKAWSLKLPDLVKFEILHYLSNKDLQNFIESE